jgi:hypothetical protein
MAEIQASQTSRGAAVLEKRNRHPHTSIDDKLNLTKRETARKRNKDNAHMRKD